MSEIVAIILAAGNSDRMNTDVSKVLHEVCGRAMLAYVFDACKEVGVSKTFVVVGNGAEGVQEQFSDEENVVWVCQEEQKGTADAVLSCRSHLADFEGRTLILCGDRPLIQGASLGKLIEKFAAEQCSLALATAVIDDPTGYGRIRRDAGGDLLGIIEHKDCTAEQLAIKEINPSNYLFDNKILFETLEKIDNANVQNEYYLTDSVSILLKEGHKVVAVQALEPEEAQGVNTREQLCQASKLMHSRTTRGLVASGVTVVDPENTWIDSRAQIGKDSVIEPFTYIHGAVKIGRDCRVGPFAYLKDDTVLEDGGCIKPGTMKC